jgi:hypothetical protein
MKDQLRRLDCCRSRNDRERHSDGYHHSTAFWVGFADYPHDSNCRNPWSNNETAEAWDRGWETGMQTTKADAALRMVGIRYGRYINPGTDRRVRSLIKEQRRPEKLAARQLHLVVDNTE